MARRVEELMAHEKFKHGSEDELREFQFHTFFFFGLRLTLDGNRSLPEKLLGGEPRQKYVWLHTEQKATRAFQSLFLGEQELRRSNLGKNDTTYLFFVMKRFNLIVQPIRVTPEAYFLFEAAAVGVPELCDAFKVR